MQSRAQRRQYGEPVERLSLSVRYGQRHTRGLEAELVNVTRSPLQIRSPRVHVPPSIIPSFPGLSKVEQSTHNRVAADGACALPLNARSLDGQDVLSFDDRRWETLKAGYRVPIDLRPLLRRLESETDVSPTWLEIWQELYHQGDVDEGSFAAIPHLVRIHRQRGVVDWNTYNLTAAVELARGTGRNPDL